VAILRDPAFKAKLIAETPDRDPNPVFDMLTSRAAEMFPLGPHANYAPDPEVGVAGRAAREDRSIEDVAYDLLLEQDGHAVLYLPSSNFAGGRLDAVRAMMAHNHTILGLGDGGAHYGYICDGSYPTTVMQYWARDAKPDVRLPVEAAVAMLTRRPAEAVGLFDRGVLAPGYRADINVIDHDRIRPHSPDVRYDLPAGGRRIGTDADGYVATVKSGTVTYREGRPTGALPGRLVRGQQSAPAVSALVGT
jgi:N-acyl-D-aspartate/D-glutamate deacylase